jgi:hypothetical protein
MRRIKEVLRDWGVLTENRLIQSQTTAADGNI